ncbi:MAG TPA: glucosamine-6-phosphate deaminase [Verrucomicrobiota bacterium]|nr:glucosamine-6-phosphate deaminase [Verrucomicrobiota bacterium]
MTIAIHQNPDTANAAATDCLASLLSARETRTVMLASGNSPLELYRRIAERRLALSHLRVFALDDYVGVPLSEPRNCANFIRRTAITPWGIPESQFFAVSSVEAEALATARRNEAQIFEAGGLDVVVLGLGQNGHLGFNEPGSAEDSAAQIIDLEPISIVANRQWFGGDYAPSKGVTTGLKTILAARHVVLLAFGSHKTEAVKAMVEGPRGPACPASFLQGHAHAHVFLDESAAARLQRPQ